MEHATFDVELLREAYSILGFLERMLREIGERENHEKENRTLLTHFAPPLIAKVKGLLREAKV